MIIRNRLAWTSLLAVSLIFNGLPLSAGTKEGEKLLAEGRKAEARNDYATALELYQKALELDPSDAAYLLASRRARFQVGQYHVDAGQRLRREGKLEEALAEFAKAVLVDPSSSMAEQEIVRTRQMLEREKRRRSGAGGGPPASPEDRGLTPIQAARKSAEDKSASILEVPELKPLASQIQNIRVNNQPVKVMFETVCKLAGINFLFDADFQDNQKRYNLDLTNSTLEEALDYVALLTKTYWKPLSTNTIFVTNDNVTKRRDYEEHVTRVFYLQNVSTPQELNEIMTVVRTITEIRKVFPFNSQNAIVVRGTGDQVALAEKILLDLDKPKSEVVVDVLVMEANKTKTRDLAATLTSGGKNGLVLGISFVGSGTTPPADGEDGGSGTGTSGSVPLGNLGSLGLNDWAVTMPGYLLQALMSDRQTRLKQFPQVRATDGQKASLRLGDRYPYATGSFQPGVGAVGVSPLVSTQFQFADVGVNVDVTPRIHSAEEVSLQVELEISSIRERIDVGGLSQPVIGQRKVNHIVRVKEGEVTLIGGLMQASSSKTKSGVPGLMNLPVIGRFFSGDSVEDIQGDLLVAIIPHVVRSPDVTPENLRSIATGTDQVWKINYAPKIAVQTPPPATADPAAASPAIPAAPKPGLPKPNPVVPGAINLPGVPATQTAPPSDSQTPSQTALPPVVLPIPAASPQGQAALAPAMPGAAQVSWVPAVTQTRVNSVVTLSFAINNATALFSAPMRLRYDPAVLRLLRTTPGDLLASDGKSVVFEASEASGEGIIVLQNNRTPGDGGISGSGILANFSFTAISPGVCPIVFEDMSFRDAQLQPIILSKPSATVTVVP